MFVGYSQGAFLPHLADAFHKGLDHFFKQMLLAQRYGGANQLLFERDRV